jgi:hypothetical protein
LDLHKPRSKHTLFPYFLLLARAKHDSPGSGFVGSRLTQAFHPPGTKTVNKIRLVLPIRNSRTKKLEEIPLDASIFLP